jgi:hypothetical protein
LIFATSPDLKGLFVAETSEEALEAAIPTAIAELYAVCGEEVMVIPAEGYSEGGGVRSWIKVPAQVAQIALEKIAERRAS